MAKRKFKIELLPHEREALLKWNYTSEVRSQLEPQATNEGIATITIGRVDLDWLVSDLNHAIVKKGCRDEDVFELSERLEYIMDTGDGKLAGWY